MSEEASPAPLPQTSISLQVNGADHQLQVPNHQTLLAVLRDHLGLKSVREGCGIGVCGSCTVLLDGRPVSSCLTLGVMAEGHALLTLEGLGVPGQLHPIQEAFIEARGFQCSYCTPGVILTVKALLDEQPAPSDTEIRDYLAGNLCRCGSYVKILDSVHEAIRRLRASAGP